MTIFDLHKLHFIDMWHDKNHKDFAKNAALKAKELQKEMASLL